MKGSEMKDNNGFIQTPRGRQNAILSGRYYALRRRCNDPKNNRYHLYGARGIKCEWTTFSDFLRDMQSSFEEHSKLHSVHNTQIDRIDPNKNYCKENCRWTNRVVQARNRRNIKPITYKGETKILSDWTQELGLEFSRTYQRIYMYGWSIEEAFSPKTHVNQFG